MAKITAYIPEPKLEYNAENQRQIIEALTTTKQQLNTSFLEDLKQEVERMSWFTMGGQC
jgi:hypothetical protein